MEGGKQAVSHYRVLERFRSHTHVRVKLETGRTHQIRVHMSHINFPLVGDPAYGGRFRIPPSASVTMVESLKNFPRQALHARFLELDHPTTGKRMSWEVFTFRQGCSYRARLEAWYASDRASLGRVMGNRRYKRYRNKIVFCLEQLGFDPKKIKIEPVEHHQAQIGRAHV